MFLFSFFMEIIREYLFLAGYVSGNASFPDALTKEEEKKYLELYAAGDMKAKNILIEHNLRLVAHIAKKYSDENNADDIISVGTIGLIKGINTFSMEKNKKLSPYISKCIENEILMHLRYGKKYQREVSIDEVIGTDKEGNNMTFADILPAPGADVSEEVSLRAETSKLFAVMKKALTPAETDIICMRYGLCGCEKKTQKEIAEKLGISRSYISRIEKRCLKKLAEEWYK